MVIIKRISRWVFLVNAPQRNQSISIHISHIPACAHTLANTHGALNKFVTPPPNEG